MPNRSLYIRVSDVPLWDNLKDKSKHISDMLRNMPPEAFNAPVPVEFDRNAYLAQQRRERMATEPATPPPATKPAPQPAAGPYTHTFTSSPSPTPNNGPNEPELVVPPQGKAALPPVVNHLPENIRDAFVPATSVTPKNPVPGHLLPCCKDIAPCKHWTWDGNEQAYRNSLTGAVKEAV